MKKIGIDARFCTDHSTGIGRHVEELIRELSKLDAANEYVCFMKASVAENFVVPGPNFRIEITDSPHYSLKEQWSFYRQISRHQFDLMVFPQFNLPVLYRRSYVVTIHDLTLHFYPGKKKTGWLSRSAYKFIIGRAVKKAAHIFAVSENTKQDLEEVLKVPTDKISVTYNGVSNVFAPVDESGRIDFRVKYKLEYPYLLYTGVLRTHKNILGMIRAYAQFSRKADERVDLVLTGPRDQTYWPEIQQLIADLGLEDRVHHLGMMPHEEMNRLFGSALAYVMPSFYEGFGIPPIEAMGCDTPVISSNTSSLPEACGEAAYYFDPEDVDDMANAMEAVTGNENLRKNLIEKGRIQAQKFKWSDMTRQMFVVYKQVLHVK